MKFVWRHNLNLCPRNRIRYNSSYDLGRGRVRRYLTGKSVDGYFKGERAEYVLHMGTLDLPLPKRPKNRRHFLFCDTTWDLWRNGSQDMSHYSKKLLADAERLESASYKQMAHIFPISEYVKENLVERYRVMPEKITVVGTGRGAIQMYGGEKSYDNGTILFVAKDRFKDKGGELLVKGFKLARELNPDLKLVVAGSEENRRYVAGLGNVEFHGYVSLEQLQSFFNEASLFAMPALNEPWGLVFLEALSCKTPVLGLARNSLPEITQNGRYGFLVEDSSPEAICAKLLEAFASPRRLRQMGEDGQKYCLENFTWEKTVQSIVEVINRY